MIESDGNTAMLTVEIWAFLSGFSCPTPTLLLLAPILLGLGEATHPELLGTKWVINPSVFSSVAVQRGPADAEVKVPSVENTELEGSPFKAWGRSVYSHTCYAYCQRFLPC